MVNLLITILVGAFIGWLAGILMKSAHGFLLSCILGIVGSAIGGWLAGVLGIHIGSGLISSLIFGVAGTCILIAIVRAIMGKKF
ncbi:MAG: GlsB/YeaQ/YmgE family stress response membrane protein [Treponema sp.]|nr:GlsB/YeaQ/YmgE family stress response membrane protein [Treponema sp.]